LKKPITEKGWWSSLRVKPQDHHQNKQNQKKKTHSYQQMAMRRRGT
jgi:hypothetical protein